jgi:hypothetical protein
LQKFLKLKKTWPFLTTQNFLVKNVIRTKQTEVNNGLSFIHQKFHILKNKTHSPAFKIKRILKGRSSLNIASRTSRHLVFFSKSMLKKNSIIVNNKNLNMFFLIKYLKFIIKKSQLPGSKHKL